MKKRILSILLSVVMLCSLLPTTAAASAYGHDGHICSDGCGVYVGSGIFNLSGDPVSAAIQQKLSILIQTRPSP